MLKILAKKYDSLNSFSGNLKSYLLLTLAYYKTNLLFTLYAKITENELHKNYYYFADNHFYD